MSTTAHLVSVIIPAYNVERFLPDAAGSALRQTWRELEVIIIDDGSTDRTAEISRGIAASDPRVRVLRKPNGGLSSARNAGIAEAQGDLVCFLDADDVFLPDKLERQVAFIDLFETCDLVYSDHYVGDGALTPLQFECRRPPSVSTRDLFTLRCWFPPMSPLIRTRLLERVGPFDESLRAAEDWDYWIRASHCGLFAYVPGPVGVYRVHADQMHNDYERMKTSWEKLIRKHYAPGSREWRMARAAVAWYDAKHRWALRERTRTAVELLRCAWHARSRAILTNAVRLPSD